MMDELCEPTKEHQYQKIYTVLQTIYQTRTKRSKVHLYNELKNDNFTLPYK